MKALETRAQEKHFHAGQVLFRAGAPVDELFLVRRGVIRVTLPLNGNDYHTLATFGRGHFFGEMAFLVHGPRSANAVATTDADVYVVSRHAFDEVSRTYPDIAVEIFAAMAHALAVRLRRADAELRALYEA